MFPGKRTATPLLLSMSLSFVVFLFVVERGDARPPIRKAFFEAYPEAVGTRLDVLPEKGTHCGVCHYDFDGGGPRNLFGQDVEATPDRTAAQIAALGNIDSDEDGQTNDVEILDALMQFSNTPTFPGLTPANVGQISNVPTNDLPEVQDHLVPLSGSDTTPPSIEVVAPNGGEMLTGNNGFTIQWTATDASGVAVIDIYFSDNDGLTFRPIALGLTNSGSYLWFVPNRPTTVGEILIVATDFANNSAEDESDNHFEIVSPEGGIAPTTLRDFDMPGTQPLEVGLPIENPAGCAACHGNYDTEVEPYFNWQGSMMAHASLDPIFLANMAVANIDAPDSGDLCLRCHFPKGWLEGRSVPTDGSAMLAEDAIGVSCAFCHRMVDPIYEEGVSPAVDAVILAGLSDPPTEFGNGMYVIDPNGLRRGPFADAEAPHAFVASPFHREAAFCGTCHDVSNPAFEKDENGNYIPNTFDAKATNLSAQNLAPVERTYSEWRYSDYNTPGGVYAPQFAGNKGDGMVAICQDCHMRDISGEGCDPNSNPTVPTRPDLPLHDMTGGSTWLPGLLPALYPGQVDPVAIDAGVERARYMLQNAATMDLSQETDYLQVTVTNQTGHKLPTGYPEGRRIWINVKIYDDANSLLFESGAYDPNTSITHDDYVQIYEVEPGFDETIAPLVGDPNGPSFHFVLNNKIFRDNRIPPRGFNNANYALFGGTPVAYSYADNQYWDDTWYPLPAGADKALVTLYYQSTSKEFVEFLQDQGGTKGQEMYDLWANNGKCPPEVMVQQQITLAHPPGDLNGDFVTDTNDFLYLADGWLMSDCTAGNDWCDGRDLDRDGTVGLGDFALWSQSIP